MRTQTRNNKQTQGSKQGSKQGIDTTMIQNVRCKYYNIAKTRENIREIIAEVARTGKCVTIGIRNVPFVMMLPIDVPVAPVGNYEYQLACIISEKLLKDAPLHIIKPQINEFASLKRKNLFALMEIEELPLSKTLRKQVLSKLSDPVILERLEKRRKIVDSILTARREGLYEALEHTTGLLTFE